jgi:hypothetical protein
MEESFTHDFPSRFCSVPCPLQRVLLRSDILGKRNKKTTKTRTTRTTKTRAPKTRATRTSKIEVIINSIGNQ